MAPLMMKKMAEHQGQEVAILAHELRGPLAAILCAVQAANETADDASASREACEIVERQARYLARMVDDVLDLSRAAQGKPVTKKGWIEVGGVIGDAIETTRPLLGEQRHRLDLSLPLEKVYLWADPARLQQIVVNLVSNAAKYTLPGGIIRLTGDATRDAVILTVRDNGIGIARDLLPRVFDLFAQGDRQTGHAESGLGVGLAVVKTLVELHGGSVAAQSDGAGTGSAFVVRLPRNTRQWVPGFGPADETNERLVA
jgi:signal transduction histidine kinase